MICRGNTASSVGGVIRSFYYSFIPNYRLPKQLLLHSELWSTLFRSGYVTSHAIVRSLSGWHSTGVSSGISHEVRCDNKGSKPAVFQFLSFMMIKVSDWEVVYRAHGPTNEQKNEITFYRDMGPRLKGLPISRLPPPPTPHLHFHSILVRTMQKNKLTLLLLLLLLISILSLLGQHRRKRSFSFRFLLLSGVPLRSQVQIRRIFRRRNLDRRSRRRRLRGPHLAHSGFERRFGKSPRNESVWGEGPRYRGASTGGLKMGCDEWWGGGSVVEEYRVRSKSKATSGEVS